MLRLLAAGHGPLYDSGREATVQRTIAAIPTAVAVSDLDSMVSYAWCHLLVDRRRFLELVEQLTWWADKANPSDATRIHVDMLRASAAVVSGRWIESGALSRQVLRDLGATGWQDPLGRFAANGVARELALSERWDDTSDEVRHTEAALSRDPERRLAFEGTRALGEALAGRPLDALRVSRRRPPRRAGRRYDASCAPSWPWPRRWLIGSSAIVRGRWPSSPRSPRHRPRRCCSVVSSRCSSSPEHTSRMASWIWPGRSSPSAEALVEEESLGADIRGWLTRVGTMLAVAEGDLDAARRWADQVDDPFWRSISAARVDLACGDGPAAVAALAAAVPRCIRHDLTLALLRARAVADRDEAMKHASAAVEMAAADGLLQTVASEGAEVIDLVEQAAWRAPEEWLDRLRRLTAEARYLEAPTGPDLIEPLTDRERDVLRFLPSRLTVREIADELYVSVNTLKFHLRVIYRKLGVNSRAEAAEVARTMTKLRR